MPRKGKKKILWVSDAVATTGFSRVAHNIIKNLSTEKYEVHHLGINYLGDPHEYKHYIYPALLGGDLYGKKRIRELVEAIKPDLFFFFNDAWIINTYLFELERLNIKDKPIVVYFPIDSYGSDAQWFERFHLVNDVCVYTEFAKQDILTTKAFAEPDKIHVIPHGVDTHKFFPFKDTELLRGVDAAKRKLYPKKIFEQRTPFIILNANRNQPRKRIDISLMAFDEFQKDKTDVMLYCHMGVEDAGVNVLKVANRLGWDKKLIMSTLKDQIPGVPDGRLNLIYNASDVGLNTSTGEGWGLTAFEHAATRRAQIVPDHSANSEIWNKDNAFMIEAGDRIMYEHTNNIARIPKFDSVVECLERAYDMWHKGTLEEYAQAAYDNVTQPKYNWKVISNQFDVIFSRLLGE